ncbi:hypothetical protein [Aquamicrobium defluvii]|uniref:Uncharacterized protein n=1 Tax=Aquamicrobium defluvii TaxID=69279 RepID=A0A4R6YE82_9HYPH|nr:hypothetical protein [Aquamicrobium defluvii]TDR34332.1 hypothetical protein DES43_115102 [Aquamicrobium defluvii]
MAQFSQPPGNQGGGFLQQLLAPEVAMPMAAALMGNQGNAANFGNAFGAYGQASAQMAGKNKTLEYFRQNAPEFAAMVEAGMPVNEAWGTYTKQRYAQQADPYKVAGGQIFDTRNQSWLSPPSDPNAPPETGLNMNLMQDENGNLIYVQPTKDGRAVQTQTPEGYRPVSPYDKALGASSGAAVGKGQGEAMVSYRSMMSKLPGLEATIGELNKLADEATYTNAGQLYDYGRTQLGYEPRDAAVARTKYIATVDNQILPLLRDTFGAQFTVEEGKALRATLGDPNKTPKEKKEVLDAFIAQKRRDVEALALQSMGSPSQGSLPAPQGGQPQGGWSDMGGGVKIRRK